MINGRINGDYPDDPCQGASERMSQELRIQCHSDCEGTRLLRVVVFDFESSSSRVVVKSLSTESSTESSTE